MVGEVGFEGHVASNMRGDQGVVAVDFTLVGSRIEPDKVSLILPTSRDTKGSLIPDLADMETKVLLNKDVVVRCGDGTLDMTRKCGFPWL
jgi:hypothetical protein